VREATLCIRDVQGEERERALRLVYEPPGPEMVGVVGDAGIARAVGACFQRAGLFVQPESVVLAAWWADELAGVLVAGRGRSASRRAPRASQRALVLGLARALPVASIPRALYGALLRSRLDFEIPEEDYHVSEVHVAPRRQRRGIGTCLLREAEARANALGCPRLSLTTLTTNPARRLYERLGYRVVGERTVAGYGRLTGARGRVLMEKPLPSRRCSS